MHGFKGLKLIWICVFFFIINFEIPIVQGNYNLICYFENDNFYSNKTSLDLEKFGVNLCTHLVYSFGTFKDGVINSTNKNLNIDLERFSNFTKLRLKNASLKTLISIRDSSSRFFFSTFSSLMRNTRTHQQFSQNVLHFIKKYNFSGIDIVWPSQNLGIGSKTNKSNFLKLIKKMHETFAEDAITSNTESFLISLSIPNNIDSDDLDSARLSKYLDWFNLMNYDAKEFFLSKKNITQYYNGYLNIGIPREKLVLGVSINGLLLEIKPINTSITLVMKDNFEVLEQNSNVKLLSYSEVCKQIKNNLDWVILNADNGFNEDLWALNEYENKMIILKDAYDIRKTTRFLIDKKLRGISFWTINKDDIFGVCINKSFPLINIAKKRFEQSSRTYRQTNIKTNVPVDISENVSKYRIVCYTTSWSIYRTGPARFDQFRVDPNLCTHLIYAYARVENETIQYGDVESDITLSSYANYVKLRTANTKLKLLIGLRVIDKQFAEVVANQDKRKMFVLNVLQYLTLHSFDGVDIIWKYPGAADKENFVLLLDELRKKFIEERILRNQTEQYLISITIPSEIELATAGYNLIKLNDLVDWYNLLSYDYHISNELVVNHHSPLYEIPEMINMNASVNSTVNHYLNSGIERTQLVVGIPTYGISFTLKDSKNNYFGSPAEGAGLKGKYTDNAGALAYFEICEGLQSSSDWQIFRPYPGSVGPFIVNDKQWVAYDDEIIIKMKAEYVADMGLGGIMFWTIDQDDFRGSCGSVPNILINTAKEALLNKLNIGSLNLISSTEVSTNLAISNKSSNKFSTKSEFIPTPHLQYEDRTTKKINNRIVCYLNNLNINKTTMEKLNQNQIDPNLCTHIIYAFGKLSEQSSFILSDTNSELDTLTQLNSFKKINPNLRVLIGVQDYSVNGTLFSEIIASKSKRQKLINSLIDFLNDKNCDGVDILIKYLKTEEKNTFVTFIKEITNEFIRAPSLHSAEIFLLTIALPGKKVQMSAYDIKTLNKFVDWFNIQSYNYSSDNELKVSHHAALFSLLGNSNDEMNVNYTAMQYLNSGADRSKLVISVPTFGRTFTLANNCLTDFGSPAIESIENNKVYDEICDNVLINSGWIKYNPYPNIVGPYIVKEDKWISFDDENMMKIKAVYVSEHGFGGLAFWTIEQDDFRGLCTGIKFPLINAAKKILDLNLRNQELPNRDNSKLIFASLTDSSLNNQKIKETMRSVNTASKKFDIYKSQVQTTLSPQAKSEITYEKTSSIFVPKDINKTQNEEDNDFEERTDRIVCYAPNWSIHRTQVAKFDASFITSDLCTHLIYAFGILKNDTVVPSDQDVDIRRMGYENFNKLKSKNSQLKTLISITQNSTGTQFSEIAENSLRRTKFANNLLIFIKMYGFDGADISWQYPGDNISDKSNFVKLLKDIKSRFQQDARENNYFRMLLTITIPSEKSYIVKGYDILELNKLVDWFNLLSYDYHTPKEFLVNHVAPLFALPGIDESENNVNFTVNNYLQAGIQRNKIVVGIPTYGISFKLANQNLTGINSPAIGPGTAGKLTKTEGILAYFEICQTVLTDPDWQIVHSEPKVMGPFAFKGTNWMAYDDESMVRIKAEYVADNGLGGLMFWTIDQDDFRGLCFKQQNILIQSGKEALIAKLSIKESTTFASHEITDSSKQNIIGNIINNQNFDCKDSGLFPNPRDCTSYYACVDLFELNRGIVSQLLRCPEGTFFDNEGRTCSSLKNNDQCQVDINGDLFESTKIRMPSTTSLNEINPSILENNDNNIINRLLLLIMHFGGFDKFEKLLNMISKIETTTEKTNLQDTSMTEKSSVSLITATEHGENFNLGSQHFNLDTGSTNNINTKFGDPKLNNNKKKVLLPAGHIYQIKEFHIHNYGYEEVKERDLALSDSQKASSTNKILQPYILVAPIQIIN